MAHVWFSVVVLIFIQNVFASENCPNPSKITSNCDMCLQCGNTWCSEPLNSDHCRFGEPDNWCSTPERPKQLTKKPSEKRKGISSGLVDSLLFLDKPHKQSFIYNSPVEKNVTHFFRNSTRNWEYVDVIIDSATCDGSKCEVRVEVAVSSGFCDRKSAPNELVDLTIQVEDIQKVSWKLHVPCACECSKVVEERAPACKGNGALSCGLCSCYEGWTGPHCNVTNCEKSRADISCENDRSDRGQCSGNGYCGPCETCVCYTNMTGWQYFDRNNFCSDICMDTIGCEHCLTNGTYGLCDPLPNEAECTHYNMRMLKFDQEVANRLDGLDRREWVKCNTTFKDPDRNVEYYAKKSEAGVSIMVITNLIKGAFTGTPTESKVPIILGVLGVLAAVAAVGGVLLWKHLHAAPPMPFSSPDYQNIDAEDCVGENPLYKSPTSTFTNPQFGKC